MTLANKAIELEYIDEFIQVFNLTNHQHDMLKRISDTTQEKPDALCLLNDRITVGLETTFIMRRVDTPHISTTQIEASLAQDPNQAIDYLRERIQVKNQKLLNIYKPENPQIGQFWLLMIGASVINIQDLVQELHQQSLYLEFDRAFLFKGICCDADLLEFRT
jgi:hypothetical protein